ncbi:Dehydrogenase/reductase SDR family member 11 [Hondaea fermentalgiana]|uniref:Dehydrogenase/reductase SDR family member 11 n=1 Tax=Hondaea fermentalgiana TaxID=2315210 RepID=A0A2R5GKB2_9STRA|nr:Dehydrogenase/reductase SDR family member 11 [Hondaea fermentalgiana]|eukprot:GBG28721.1 Dehydrogenase/reductase SDR family member 11 [Hondaea fermentalgiana]
MRYAEYWLKGLDLVINAAGYVQPGDLGAMGISDMDVQIDVNLKGTVLGTKEASRLMQFQAANGSLPIGGHIVNFSCLNALALAPGCAIYVASKHAVRGFSLCTAKELAPDGIFVTVMTPDTIATPMAAQMAQHEGCAATFSDPLLRLELIQDIFFKTVLRNRPTEVVIAGSRARKIYAVVSNYFHSSRFVIYYERIMQYFAHARQERARADAAASS